jgi:hypothetical protein
VWRVEKAPIAKNRRTSRPVTVVRILPDNFRDMADVTLALVSHADSHAGRTYLLSIAERYGQLAEEAERAYAPFEPARVYGASLYFDDAAGIQAEFSAEARCCPKTPLLVAED